MSFDGFMTCDPYLTFAEGERGFQERIFLRADSTPTATWYDLRHDGHGFCPLFGGLAATLMQRLRKRRERNLQPDISRLPRLISENLKENASPEGSTVNQ